MSNGRSYRRGRGRRCRGVSPWPRTSETDPQGPGGPAATVPAPSLRTLEEWEDDPTCPNCGPVERLSSGWMVGDEEPSVLHCAECWTPLVRW